MNIINSNLYQVYIIINMKKFFNEKKFFENITYILKSDIKIIQLRYKYDNIDFFKYIAYKLKIKCDEYQIKLIINDNIDIMYKINASGIHLGQKDLTNIDYEKLIFNKKIFGITTKTLEQALIAKNNGANYLGVGAIFHSKTKKDSHVIGINGLTKITYNINIPIIAIGGINLNNISKLINTNISGIAVISLIENAKNKTLILKKLLLQTSKIIGI